MTILDRYLARRFVSNFLAVVFSLVMLFVLVDLLTHQQENIIKYQVPANKVVEYYLTLTPRILFEYHAVALAVLVAGLMVAGRAAQDHEITAALAGGIGLWRLLRAPIVLTLLLAAAAFCAQETVGASATRRSIGLENQYFRRFALADRSPVSWANLGEGWTCHVLKFNRAAMTGQDVFLHNMGEDLVQEIRAGRIYWEPGQAAWIIEDGLWCALHPKQGWAQEVRAIRQETAPFREPPEDLFALDEPTGAKSAGQLAADLKRAASRGLPVHGHWVDYHAKFARPALCFVMVWLAIPFAIRLRRGGLAIGFGVSVAIALAYLLVFFAATGLGHLGKLPPAVAAWLANALFMALGAVLAVKTPT